MVDTRTIKASIEFGKAMISLREATERLGKTLASVSRGVKIDEAILEIERERRRRPRFICWMLGHTPTEMASFQRDTYICRCGATGEVAGELVWNELNHRWVTLVGR